MKFLYISDACSVNKYDELFSDCKVKPTVQSMKFNRLIAEGLASNKDVEVVCLTKLPLNKETYKSRLYKGEKEEKNGVKYIYIPILNIRVISNIVTFIYSFLYSLIFSFKNKDSILILDVLNVSIGLATTSVYKIRGMKSVGIITDLPQYISNSIKKYIDKIIGNCKYYVLMTEAMNEVINPNNKKSVVIEGISDIKMKEFENKFSNKFTEKIIVYAGSFDERFGILKLINAFKMVEDKDARLQIFGRGDSESEIIELIKGDNRIYFGGMILNKDVMKIESKATLLVNPRPSDEELTKYSFPSKTMEYMSTGTPVLMTKLKGIPEEYYKYAFTFEDESIEGISKKITEVLNIERKDLHVKGIEAKEFILNDRNNVSQVKKIINMINDMLNKD